MQSLAQYVTPANWDPGAPLWRRALWRLVGLPLLESHVPGTPWRKWLLTAFGAHLGRGGRYKPFLRITSPWRLSVGDHCWMGEGLWIDNLAQVTIGHHVCLSQGAYLCTGNHDFRSPAFTLRAAAIRIDHQAWIAAKAVVGPGVHVGAGAVVALATVVTADVPPGAILRGNPACVVGRR